MSAEHSPERKFDALRESARDHARSIHAMDPEVYSKKSGTYRKPHGTFAQRRKGSEILLEVHSSTVPGEIAFGVDFLSRATTGDKSKSQYSLFLYPNGDIVRSEVGKDFDELAESSLTDAAGIAKKAVARDVLGTNHLNDAELLSEIKKMKSLLGKQWPSDVTIPEESSESGSPSGTTVRALIEAVNALTTNEESVSVWEADNAQYKLTSGRRIALQQTTQVPSVHGVVASVKREWFFGLSLPHHRVSSTIDHKATGPQWLGLTDEQHDEVDKRNGQLARELSVHVPGDPSKRNVEDFLHEGVAILAKRQQVVEAIRDERLQLELAWSLDGQTDGTPLEIRGHHFKNLVELFQGKTTPEELASEFRETVTRTQWFWKGGRRYKKDVFGVTPEQGEKAEAGMRKVYGEIMNLAPDARIELVAGKKDGICRSCVIGNHCSHLRGERADAGYINAFKERARRIGLQGDILIAASQDGLPISLSTSARTLRAVVSTFAGTTREQYKAIEETYFTGDEPPQPSVKELIAFYRDEILFKKDKDRYAIGDHRDPIVPNKKSEELEDRGEDRYNAPMTEQSEATNEKKENPKPDVIKALENVGAHPSIMPLLDERTGLMKSYATAAEPFRSALAANSALDITKAMDDFVSYGDHVARRVYSELEKKGLDGDQLESESEVTIEALLGDAVPAALELEEMCEEILDKVDEGEVNVITAQPLMRKAIGTFDRFFVEGDVPAAKQEQHEPSQGLIIEFDEDQPPAYVPPPDWIVALGRKRTVFHPMPPEVSRKIDKQYPPREVQRLHNQYEVDESIAEQFPLPDRDNPEYERIKAADSLLHGRVPGADLEPRGDGQALFEPTVAPIVGGGIEEFYRENRLRDKPEPAPLFVSRHPSPEAIVEYLNDYAWEEEPTPVTEQTGREHIVIHKPEGLPSINISRDDEESGVANPFWPGQGMQFHSEELDQSDHYDKWYRDQDRDGR